MSRRLRLFGFASTAVLVGVLSLPSWANHSWGNYHWARKSNPFTLQLIDSVTSTWQSPLDQSSAKWSTPTVTGVTDVLDLAVVPGDSTSKTRKRCAAVSGKVRVCNATYGQNGWLGLAQIWLNSSGHITAGTAKMNDSYGWYWDSRPWERNHVMCQEVGHTFGLGHQDESGAVLGTCMDYSDSTASQWPNRHDYEQLAAIYSHLDSTTTVAATSSSQSASEGCRGRECSEFDGENWGYLIRQSKHEEVYMRRLPGGGAMITHLYLVSQENE